MGGGVKLVNTGVATAEVVKEALAREGIASDGASVSKEFYTSDDPALFESVASPFLGSGLPAGTKHFNTDRYEI